MKAQLRSDGTLEVTAENELESYALSKWCADNFNAEIPVLERCKNMVISMDEGYAERVLK